MSRGQESHLDSALPVTAVNLPLLGSRLAPESTFQYLLQAIDVAGATFSCPSWVVRREHFQTGDRVDFHLPFRTRDGWHRQHGEIVEITPDADRTGQICRALFRDRQPLHHPVWADLETGEIRFLSAEGEPIERDELVRRVLHDCLLQKQGVGVYFKHLVPLFSRITQFPTEDYSVLRATMLEDVRGRIAANISAFEGWYQQAHDGATSLSALLREIDLENLRTATEPEIEGDLFHATFDTPTIRPYLGAIRLLEHKLFLNYNTLVLLFAQGL